METYIVSLNNGIEGTDYCAFHIFNQKGDVVAIARTNKIKLLELEKIKDELNMEALINAIKDRFPGIDIKDCKDTSKI